MNWRSSPYALNMGLQNILIEKGFIAGRPMEPGFLLVVIVIQIGVAFGAASFARGKGRDPVVWAIICFVLGFVLSPLIALLIIAFAPSLKFSGPLDVRKVGYDEDGWARLVNSSPEIAASAEQLHPFGERWVAVLASYLLVSDDRRNLPAITRALLDKAKAEAQRAVPDSEFLDRLGRNVEAILRSPRRTMARLKDGTAVVNIDGQFEVFISVRDYKLFYKDHDRWNLVSEPAQVRAFVSAARNTLEDVDRVERWERLLRSDGDIAANFRRLRPYDAKYGRAFAEYLLASDDRTNVAAIANALLEKAQVEKAQADSRASQGKSSERSTNPV